MSASTAKVSLGWSRSRLPPRRCGLRTRAESWGLFCWSERRRDVGARRAALPTERRRGSAGRTRGARVGERDARGDGRPEVLRPARDVAARVPPRARVRRRRVRRRARLRRLVDPRLAGDPGLGHAAHAGRLERDPRPGDGGAHAVARLRDRRPGDARAVREGSARRRPSRRGAPSRLRHRRHRLLRPRVRVLRLRRGALRPRAEPVPLLGRLGGGLLELRQARPRLHRASEGGLLPGGAVGLAPRPPHARWC